MITENDRDWMIEIIHCSYVMGWRGNDQFRDEYTHPPVAIAKASEFTEKFVQEIINSVDFTVSPK